MKKKTRRTKEYTTLSLRYHFGRSLLDGFEIIDKNFISLFTMVYAIVNLIT